MRAVAQIATVIAGLVSLATATASERTIRLSVPGMTCASCPYIVEQTLSAVAGVTAVKAQFDERSATVTFDDALTSRDAILEAAAGVGYPSTVMQAGEGQ
ncbi:MAG: periplasmic mercury ion-binding protein [Alphaproteobacteria bacterium]|nr:MAG: periplasmic mercury ion-binding protein [Alphaproteobacteria bacterium]